MAEDETLLPLGQLFVRVGLYATGKGEAGREQRDRTLTEIKKPFLDALRAKLGRLVQYLTWFATLQRCSPGQLRLQVVKRNKWRRLPQWIARKAGVGIGNLSLKNGCVDTHRASL